jgi:heme-degrading monooxygenase HmoA
MLAVIFEVSLAEGKEAEYLDIAMQLRQHLKDIDGFISIERFKSLSEEGKILSLSYWKDEASIQNWRNLETHRSAQSKGRSNIFSDYRLRVCEIVRDYGMADRKDAPADSKEIHS